MATSPPDNRAPAPEATHAFIGPVALDPPKTTEPITTIWVADEQLIPVVVEEAPA